MSIGQDLKEALRLLENHEVRLIHLERGRDLFWRIIVGILIIVLGAVVVHYMMNAPTHQSRSQSRRAVVTQIPTK